MARRRTVRNKMPLEWKTDRVDTSDATVTTGEFDLDLLPDEIAEIVCISQNIEIQGIVGADDDVDTHCYLSLDPDASGDPEVAASIEDLETFFYHNLTVNAELETSGFGAAIMSHDKTIAFESHPILVGTNISQVVKGDGTLACRFVTTIYFKRRAATAMELNQILLKRR